MDLPTSSSGNAPSGQIFDPQYDGYLQDHGFKAK